MSSSEKDRKEISRVADCLIPLVDPSEEQVGSLMQEYSYLIEKNLSAGEERKEKGKLILRLKQFIGYLFATNKTR